MPGQELFSPVESHSVGQLMRRADNITERKLPLDSGSFLWLWAPAAAGAAAFFKWHATVSPREASGESTLIRALFDEPTAGFGKNTLAYEIRQKKPFKIFKMLYFVVK